MGGKHPHRLSSSLESIYNPRPNLTPVCSQPDTCRLRAECLPLSTTAAVRPYGQRGAQSLEQTDSRNIDEGPCTVRNISCVICLFLRPCLSVCLYVSHVRNIKTRISSPIINCETVRHYSILTTLIHLEENFKKSTSPIIM